MPDAIREAARFLRCQWPHLLLAAPGALLVTLLHEASHAVAAVAQGGRLIRFQWLPNGGQWGRIEYTFPVSAPHSPFAISLYRDRAVSRPAYLVLCAVALAGIVAVSCGGFF